MFLQTEREPNPWLQGLQPLQSRGSKRPLVSRP